MKYYRSLALAAAFAGGLALPAAAQTVAPTPAPQADTAAPQTNAKSPVPDVGVKKATPMHVQHAHHLARHKSTKPATTK